MGSRSAATTIIWLAYLTLVGIAMGELGNWAILLAFVMMMPLIPIMGLMWNTKTDSAESRSQYTSEKRKRYRIDQVIHDMSDEDLAQLKQRLMYHDIGDAGSGYMHSDDGEIVMMPDKKRR